LLPFEATKTGVFSSDYVFILPIAQETKLFAFAEVPSTNPIFSVVEAFVGHGIGRQMHEDPQVPNFLSDQLQGNGDFRLEPGLIIAVEPMVNMGTKRVRTMPDHWTQVTVDGQPSAHFEHTIAMTDSGPYVLTSAPDGEQQEGGEPDRS